jgi:hypothetical protein
MNGMRILLRLVWKSLAKLLKRLGLSAFLVPVAALGMAMFRVELWTIAAVVLALALTIWRPAGAALQILTDHPGAEYHTLPTGHFALEDRAAEIGALMRDFLARTIQA